MAWVWDIQAAMLRRLERDGFTPSVYGVWLKTNWSDATFSLAVTGRWGFKLYDELRRATREGYIFLDIGANFGCYSLAAAAAKSCKAVIAVEPNPFVLSQLHLNKDYNFCRNMDVIDVAISSQNGTASLFFRHAHLGTANLRASEQEGEKVQVNVRDKSILDEIATKRPRQKYFVKIDVEGAEPEVLNQIVTSDLASLVDSLFVEVSPKWVSAPDVQSIFSAAEKMGLKEVWRSKGISQYDVLFERNKNSKRLEKVRGSDRV